ncbi:patatin-like phospholipase family protein [Burkholderia cepacia]|uniref:patatin-like phospholipase family protein n=1 Tax=Burkholderia cepacia TaxID=292 RepID=UPI0023491152|nr:patatin-like phospholipase family protein [Burkholderia cepacia]MDC6105266.1 patatin-like phospholipase family protein [Burkholderia cepacia]
MQSSQRNKLKQPHRIELPAYDEIGLVLQGGGALGAYQAGVYEGMAEVGVEPTQIAGVSIGALNTAIIAGNAPADRTEALRGFWNTVSQPTDPLSHVGAYLSAWPGLEDVGRRWSSAWAATRTLIEGQGGFFAPRMHAPFAGFGRKRPDQVSYYDTSALRDTLLRYANFDRINDGNIRVSVGAVNVRTGNLVYFDNSKMRLAPEHFIASGALPPGFPAVEIDGEFYWDGGLVSNTPLTEIIRESQHKDTLVFQLDLWSARGKLPGDFLDVSERTKDIQYSSRTRAITAFMSQNQKHAQMIKALLEHIPEHVRLAHPLLRDAQKTADGSAVNVVHLIYKNKTFEGHYKDYEFSKDTMREHWASGLEDIRRTFGHPEWFEIPSREIGFVTRDVHRYRQDVDEPGWSGKVALPARQHSPEQESSVAR